MWLCVLPKHCCTVAGMRGVQLTEEANVEKLYLWISLLDFIPGAFKDFQSFNCHDPWLSDVFCLPRPWPHCPLWAVLR